MMKTLFLSTAVIGLFSLTISAQTFSPSGGTALPSGVLGQAYSAQVLSFTVPATATVDVSALSPIPIPGLPSIDADVTNVTWSVEGLPTGMTATCDASPCTYVANASGTITIAGTPTEAGNFTINIVSSVEGSATLPAPVSQTIAFPQPLSGPLDENGYTMSVVDPNGIEENNEVFSLSLYPNPTVGNATLDVNSTVAGQATIDIYSITGAMVQTSTQTIRTGSNRIALDLTALPAGIYMVKADINGHEALIRVQKK